MNRFPSFLLLTAIAGICFALPQSAKAESIIYDNGLSTHSGGVAIGHFIGAADFDLSNDAYITRASVDIHDGSPHANWDGTVEWWILEDNRGEPGNTVAFGAGQNVTKRNVAVSPSGSRDLTVEFSFGQQIHITTGKSYWLALHFQAGYDKVSVFWDHAAYIQDSPAYGGGELVGGAPDFNGLFGGFLHFDTAFRLFGEWTGRGPDPGRRTGHLHGVLHEFCKIEYSTYREKPKLVCNYPWALEAQKPSFEDEGSSPARAFRGNTGAMRGITYRKELDLELVQLFRRGINQKTFENSLSRIAKIIELVPTGIYFDDKTKASILDTLKSSINPDFRLARALVEGMNAMELDHLVPSIQPVEIKAGNYSSAELSGVAWLTFKDLKKPGKLNLEVKKDAVFPGALQEFLSGSPFAIYHFDFTGKLEETGYIDVSLYFGGVNFPDSLQQLRIFELEGQSFRDITIGVDPRRKIITGRTDKLTNYVIMIPISNK